MYSRQHSVFLFFLPWNNFKITSLFHIFSFQRNIITITLHLSQLMLCFCVWLCVCVFTWTIDLLDTPLQVSSGVMCWSCYGTLKADLLPWLLTDACVQCCVVQVLNCTGLFATDGNYGISAYYSLHLLCCLRWFCLLLVIWLIVSCYTAAGPLTVYNICLKLSVVYFLSGSLNLLNFDNYLYMSD